MTRQNFIDLLTEQWPDVPAMLKHISLIQVCRNLAIDAFLRNLQNSTVDILRVELSRVYKGETFSFKG